AHRDAPTSRGSFQFRLRQHQCTLQNGQSAGAVNNVPSSSSNFIKVNDAPVISIDVAYLPTSGSTISIPLLRITADTRRKRIYNSSTGVAPRLLTMTPTRLP